MIIVKVLGGYILWGGYDLSLGIIYHYIYQKGGGGVEKHPPLTSEPLDGFLNFKKVKWSELNFQCIELLPCNQAATKAAATAAI